MFLQGYVPDHTLLLEGRRYPESPKSAVDEVWVISKQHHHLLQQTIFEYTAPLNSMRDVPMGHGFDCGDGSYIDWHQRHVVHVFSALSSGCLVYRAFGAAVATMV